MQTFTLPAAFATARITDIILTSRAALPQGNPFLAAATVATTSGPSQLVLLGSGVAPDVTNNATTTVVSGSSCPGQVSVVLDPGSDSGVKGDDLTNVTTPTFDVTVNEAGVDRGRLQGRRQSLTATQTVAAAGTVPVHLPRPLPDGTLHHQGRSSRRPPAPRSRPASRVTIDTQAPDARRRLVERAGPALYPSR